MTDKKDQSSLSDLYVAIANGTGYKTGDIFKPVDDGILQGINAGLKGFYNHRDGKRAPIFFVGQLMESPDFKPIEDKPEVVEPKTSSEKPSPRYRALKEANSEREGVYYFVGYDGKVWKTNYSDTFEDDCRIKLGNDFPYTPEGLKQAKAVAEKIRAIFKEVV